ncbi:MAG: Frag1/DRAM/Sfk1 family protein [Gammaproteobacteria bacterium]|nr:Frag1/DRAM/Sfk1 family protein [Gammaproteobacteria bacterium]MDH5214554.1 Frag1/DRAM/Sfk1 family protein [Gammaproteobacteria bacterium]
MKMRMVPIVAGLAPIIAIHLCYLIAIQHSLLPGCIPYVEGCVSISATGRYEPASYLFKAVMLPNSMLLFAYWLLNVAWLRTFEISLGVPARRYRSIAALGSGGALFLILYVIFLGSAEPFYEFMRRFGVYLYFALSVFAQILLASRSLQLATQAGIGSLALISKWQLALAVAPFALGILNLVLKAALQDSNQAENIIEWIFALMMQSFFVLSYFSWKLSGFRAEFQVFRRPDVQP